MMTAVRAYEANITVIDASKNMVRRSLDIISE
jgi:flagellar basal body rod protein FlgC